MYAFFLNRLNSQINHFHLKGINSLRKSLNLQQYTSIQEFYTKGDQTIYLDAPQLFNCQNLPSNHHFVGPLTWDDQSQLPHWWDDISSLKREKIFLTAGSSGNQKPIDNLAKSLIHAGYCVLLASKKTNLVPIKEKLYLAQYIPGHLASKMSDIVICNGGSGAVYQSLKAGTPLVCLPTNMDQHLIANQIQNKNLGIFIRTEKVSGKYIVNSVNDLLKDKNIRFETEKFAFDIKEYNALTNIESIVKSIINISLFHQAS